MPSHYAHYRFGAQMLPGLPADIRRPVQRFRRLYDAGTHGPDLFFYYNLLVSNPTGALREKYHGQSGIDFFTMVCRRYRLEPTEAGEAFLYGLLAHYCLDSVCNPAITAAAEGLQLNRAEIETEFDRSLLSQEGKAEPHTYDFSRHMKLTKGECDTAASFFPPANQAQVQQSISHMASVTKWLCTPPGPRRTALNAALHLTGDRFTPLVMTPGPNPRCAHLDEALYRLYLQAAERYPLLAEQLTAHLTYNAPLGEDFLATFG